MASANVHALDNFKCNSNCVTGYGELLGKTKNGVEAFSNCNNKCIVFEQNFFDNSVSGIKWQCVEFARRWLMENYGLMFKSVNIAADIWSDVDSYINIENDSKMSVTSILNGSTSLPVRGDLLIYNKSLFGTGHVAVVTAVSVKDKQIYIAEQNYKNEKWMEDHSRSIMYKEVEGRFWLDESDLLGWKHATLEEGDN